MLNERLNSIVTTGKRAETSEMSAETLGSQKTLTSFLQLGQESIDSTTSNEALLLETSISTLNDVGASTLTSYAVPTENFLPDSNNDENQDLQDVILKNA